MSQRSTSIIWPSSATITFRNVSRLIDLGRSVASRPMMARAPREASASVRGKDVVVLSFAVASRATVGKRTAASTKSADHNERAQVAKTSHSADGTPAKFALM